MTISVTISVTRAFLAWWWKSWCIGVATVKPAENRVMMVAVRILKDRGGDIFEGRGFSLRGDLRREEALCWGWTESTVDRKRRDIGSTAVLI